MLKMFNIHLKTHNIHACELCEENFPSAEEIDKHKCSPKPETKEKTQNKEKIPLKR